MKRYPKFAIAILVCSIATSVSAQQPFSNIQQTPTVSPYLNLLNFRNGAAGLPNYQTLVRPQLQTDQQFAQQQKQISRLQRQQAGLASGQGLTGGGIGASTQIRGTGHVTRFMDTSHFFTYRQ